MIKSYVLLRNSESETKSLTRTIEETDAYIEVADLSGKDVSDLQRDPSVIAATPDIPVKLISPVDNPMGLDIKNLFMDSHDEETPVLEDDDEATWGIRAVRADTSGYTGKQAVVAVLDTGIDKTHERFAGVNIETRNFTNEADEDLGGHGTHCAGTIFGQNIAGKPRIGVAPGIEKALIGKVLGRNGGSTSQVAAGIHWAVNQGAHIISMSLGSDLHSHLSYLTDSLGYSPESALSVAIDSHASSLRFYEAVANYSGVEKQGQHGAVIIAASGNASRRYIEGGYEVPSGLPAAASGIISVGALGRIGDMEQGIEQPQASKLSVTYFSNYNNAISAPGLNVLSAYLGGAYQKLNGTSMATPHVAGVAALWAEKQILSQGIFKTQTLNSHLQGNATLDNTLHLDPAAGIDYQDIGIGLVQAPQ